MQCGIYCKLKRSCGHSFTFSEFDRVGGLGFAFDVFCVTEPFDFELLALPSVALYFLTEDGLRIIQNVSK